MRGERQQRGTRDDRHIHPELDARMAARTFATDELNHRPQGQRVNDNRDGGRHGANPHRHKYVYAALRTRHSILVWRLIARFLLAASLGTNLITDAPAIG